MRFDTSDIDGALAQLDRIELGQVPTIKRQPRLRTALGTMPPRRPYTLPELDIDLDDTAVDGVPIVILD
jgi:hypothetical protein